MDTTKKTISIIALVAGLLISPAIASAADTGYEDCGSGTASGSPAWSSPSDVCGNDGQNSYNATLSGTSGSLIATNFGFAVPAGSTIDGVEVTIEREKASGTSCADYRVQLYDVTGYIGDDQSEPLTNWPTSMGTKVYGGSTENWGYTLDVDDVNASTFGVGLQATGVGSANCRVDYIQMKVFYTETYAVIDEVPGAMIAWLGTIWLLLPMWFIAKAI